jgi:adenosylcobinamide kinase / adenosylcobinamide-phosphate guanylyltransferase
MTTINRRGGRTALVLGGARSGKSRYALSLAERARAQRVYVATAGAEDDEMRRRIARHQTERGAGWTTIEAPLAIVEAISTHAGPDRVVLVDCLTLWLSNLLGASADVEQSIESLAAATSAAAGPVVLVSNELGMGLVPETALGREFRDAHGRMNQRIALICDRVAFVVAGVPMQLKPCGEGEFSLN